MKPSLVAFGLVSSLLVTAPWAVFGDNPPPKTPSLESGASPSTAPSTPPKPGKEPRGPLIDGERFTTRQILDPQQGRIPVCVFIAPATWKDQSQVVWNYAHVSSPVKIGAGVENPSNSEAFFAFPAAEFFSLRPDAGYYAPGQNLGGLIYSRQPLPQAQALLAIVRQLRANASNLKVIGSKDLPDLADALRLPKSDKQRGIGLKISYDFNGTPVEEEFYAVHYAVEIPYDGPQGRTWQVNWGLNSVHSFRAPKGTLDRRRPVFAAIARSFRPNPAWQQRLAAVNVYLQEQFNRQLQAGYDQIAAAGQLSRQISANNDAMLAAIDARLRASSTPNRSASERSANDKFSDYVRGVETVDDPYYGTSQHSSTETYHWTDGYGTYRNSNDPSYNPNASESSGWQLMTPTR
jgi:hypothetical protein